MCECVSECVGKKIGIISSARPPHRSRSPESLDSRSRRGQKRRGVTRGEGREESSSSRRLKWILNRPCVGCGTVRVL